jgi:hypothetical protein
MKNYSGAYKGVWWAVVMGHKDRDITPLPLLQYIKTGDRQSEVARLKSAHPGRIIRAIRQPNPPIFERGM